MASCRPWKPAAWKDSIPVPRNPYPAAVRQPGTHNSFAACGQTTTALLRPAKRASHTGLRPDRFRAPSQASPVCARQYRASQQDVHIRKYAGIFSVPPAAHRANPHLEPFDCECAQGSPPTQNRLAGHKSLLPIRPSRHQSQARRYCVQCRSMRRPDYSRAAHPDSLYKPKGHATCSVAQPSACVR